MAVESVTNALGQLAATAVQSNDYTAQPGDMVLVSTFSRSVTVSLPNAPPIDSRVAITLDQQDASLVNTVTAHCLGSDVFDIAGSGKTNYTAALAAVGQAILFRYTTGGAWVIESGTPVRAVSTSGNLIIRANAARGSGNSVQTWDGSLQLDKVFNVANTQSHGAGGRAYLGENGGWQEGIDVAAATAYRDRFTGPGDSTGSLFWDFHYMTHPGTTAGTSTLVLGKQASASQAISGQVQTTLGIVGERGVATAAIISGALPTVSPASGTAFQCSTTRDVFLAVPTTYTLLGSTLKVELSPDNVTYSTLVTEAPGVAGDVAVLTLQVPAGWWVKLTATNATIGTGTYY